MKKILITLTSVLLLSMMSACSTKPKDTDVDFVVEDVVKEMTEVSMPDMMAFPDSLEQYEIDASKINEFAGIGGSMIDANRIVIFEVKDVKDLPEVEALAKKAQENLINAFKQYLPDPLVVAENSKVIVKGKYVAFISVKEIDKAIAVFDAQFDKK